MNCTMASNIFLFLYLLQYLVGANTLYVIGFQLILSLKEGENKILDRQITFDAKCVHKKYKCVFKIV